MNQYYLSLPGGLTAGFQTACDVRANAQSLLYLNAHIPGAQFLNEKPVHIDFNVHHEFADKSKLTTKGNDITFQTPKADEFSRSICHLLYAVQRRESLKKQFYPVHAACVGQGDDFSLIIGHSGAGKTTLAQHIVENSDRQLFSGNKTVVSFGDDNEVQAVAGTRTMTRLDDDYQRKTYELPTENYTSSPDVNISAIHIVQLNDGVEETRKIIRSTAVHLLYPFFMDAVNADIIVGDHNVFDGSSSSKVKHHLRRNLKQSLKTIPTHKSSGSLDFLANRILSP